MTKYDKAVAMLRANGIVPDYSPRMLKLIRRLADLIEPRPVNYL